MTVALAYFDDIPQAPPMFDRVAIEQARLVRIARDHLASHERSVDYAGLAEGRNSTVLAARQWVKRQRAKGVIFVVDHGTGTLIPSFQLDEVFDVDERVGRVVARLNSADMSGWAIWQWFTAFNPWIEARPIDVLDSSDLERAIAGLIDA